MCDGNNMWMNNNKIDDSEMVGIECQDDMMLYFTGFLVLPSNANKFHENPSKTSILDRDENRIYYLMCSPSRMWSFDYSEDLRGVWFENDNGWYKLLNPSKKYAPIYAPFKAVSVVLVNTLLIVIIFC